MDRRKIITILLAILVILLIGAASYYIYYNSQKSDKEKENTQTQTNEAKKQTDKGKTSNDTTKTSTPCASTLTDSDKIMIETWKTYENSTYKYSFKYPENWVITANKNDIVTFTDEADKTSFEFVSGVSGGSTDGLKKTSEKEATVACKKATVRYYETIAPIIGGHDRYITTSFKKDGTWYMVDISYKFIGASLSSDIVEAYDLILKTVEFK